MQLSSLSLITVGTLAIAAPASAALSGFYNSAEQINQILSSSEVADALRQAPIGMITNSGTRKDGAIEWTITTQRCDLKVYLKPQPPKGVGKTTYALDKVKPCK